MKGGIFLNRSAPRVLTTPRNAGVTNSAVFQRLLTLKRLWLSWRKYTIAVATDV